MSVLLWIILPYCCFASCLIGTGWRYRRDRHDAGRAPRGESRAHAVGTQLVGWGMWAVIASRVMDLLTDSPAAPTPLGGAVMGVQLAGGVTALSGAAMLLAPRVTQPRGKPRTGPLDRLTVPLLLAGVVTGITIVSGPFSIVDSDGPAQTLFPWFRSLFGAHPEYETMRQARVVYQIRAMVVLALIAVWPYTRLGGVIARSVRWFVSSRPLRLTPAIRALRCLLRGRCPDRRRPDSPTAAP